MTLLLLALKCINSSCLFFPFPLKKSYAFSATISSKYLPPSVFVLFLNLLACCLFRPPSYIVPSIPILASKSLLINNIFFSPYCLSFLLAFSLFPLYLGYKFFLLYISYAVFHLLLFHPYFNLGYYSFACLFVLFHCVLTSPHKIIWHIFPKLPSVFFFYLFLLMLLHLLSL